MSRLVDHFERLGLPRRFSLDRAALEREYIARSREVHPDYHANDELKTADSASLNSAYVTLKDPFRRAEYLLTILGGPTATEEKNQDPSFLMEMMEIRERIESIEGDEAKRRELEDNLMDRCDQLLATIGPQLDSIPTDRASLLSIRKELNAVRTIQSLLRQLDGEPAL